MLKLLKSFTKSKDGVAATEFALIAPVLITLMLGTIEFSKYTLVDRRAEMTVHMMAEFLSRDPDARMSWNERNVLYSMTKITNATAWNDRAGIEGTQAGWNLSYSFSSVAFDKQDSSCQGIECEFIPDPQWVLEGWSDFLGDLKSTCNVQLVPNDSQISGSTIPEGMAGNSGLVRAQIGIGYTPLIDTKYLPKFAIKHSSMKKTRDGRPLGLEWRASWRSSRCT